jgi:alkylated DNA repair protein (DNA oxidative demethylase)
MDLFNQQPETHEVLCLAPDAYLLKGFALNAAQFSNLEFAQLLAALKAVIKAAPFRHMVTPGGFTMSVAMTNCGELGWVTARTGYRYTEYDPLHEKPWPPMPAIFSAMASQAAAAVGFKGFQPDACLINRYDIGARMSLHQDKDERDYTQPIVSVSLGLPATFQLGGFVRSEKPLKLTLAHGDVVVWGGTSRMRYHGILPLKSGLQAPDISPALKDCRINLTFRKAG